VERMKRGDPVRLSSTPSDRVEEHFFVGLRLAEGIRPDAGEWKRFEAPIDRFVGEGLLERSGERLRLTDRGVLFSNEVFAEFVT
jgi:coproporphyrinogen III oxidase-like Fe-S oxidoreductase